MHAHLTKQRRYPQLPGMDLHRSGSSAGRLTVGVKARLVDAVGLEAGGSGVSLPHQRHRELEWMTAHGDPGGEDWVSAHLSSSYSAGEPSASFSAPLCSIKPGPVYTSENAVHTSGAT